ncbi:MAG: orotidine-5'-phosphate decarboxylase [Dehalococcoidia bacterium]|nr:orotidine-5'-phosphate decarboxylase [Dehalococcoidia bacterium]
MTSSKGFIDKLHKANENNASLICVGLDPDPALMPIADIFEFNKAIIDATADLVCAYKPNLAFYEAQGLKGLEALYRTRSYIPSSIPVIGDAKRGDIGNTASAYARALFESLDFDAATLNPYLGRDAVDPFLAYESRCSFILCRTSNKGAIDFQNLEVADKNPGPAATGDRMPLYEMVAKRAREWNTRGNVGLVVGATYPEELKMIRLICPDMPILIPGIGAQGGDLEAAVRNGIDREGRNAIICSSRQVLYASRHEDFAMAARQVAINLRQEINSILASRNAGDH